MNRTQANKIWGYSSAGRALEWHSRGQRFDPAYLHQNFGIFGFRSFFLFLSLFLLHKAAGPKNGCSGFFLSFFLEYSQNLNV